MTIKIHSSEIDLFNAEIESDTPFLESLIRKGDEYTGDYINLMDFNTFFKTVLSLYVLTELQNIESLEIFCLMTNRYKFYGKDKIGTTYSILVFFTNEEDAVFYAMAKGIEIFSLTPVEIVIVDDHQQQMEC